MFLLLRNAIDVNSIFSAVCIVCIRSCLKLTRYGDIVVISLFYKNLEILFDIKNPVDKYMLSPGES